MLTFFTWNNSHWPCTTTCKCVCLPLVAVGEYTPTCSYLGKYLGRYGGNPLLHQVRIATLEPNVKSFTAAQFIDIVHLELGYGLVFNVLFLVAVTSISFDLPGKMSSPTAA